MAERPLSRRASGRVYAEYIVRREQDRDELRRMLAPHRMYGAYALGQLQPGLFERSQWWVSRGAGGHALLLHSQGGLGNALFGLGTSEALDALLGLHPGPRHTFLTCQMQHLEVAQRYYKLADYDENMTRLVVDRETFRAVDGNVRRLDGGDVHKINRLYRTDGTPAFYTAENIDAAVYYAAFDGDHVVAVAGTHVMSADEEIAVVGNVFTQPSYRNQGLGELVTSAVTRELLKSCREVVLSVDPRNGPAVQAYLKLGYREVGRLIEAPAVRRDLAVGAWLRRTMATVRGRRYGAELVSVRV